MQRYLSRGLAVVILIVVAAAVFAVAWGPLAVVGAALTFLIDALTAGDRVPAAAPVLWAVWGAVAGAAVGLWMVADSADLRERRTLIVTVPLFVLLVIAAMAHVV